MGYLDLKLKRQQLSRKIKPLQEFSSNFPDEHRSWIRMMRQALGITTYQLARLMNNHQSRITRMEQDEADQKVTLETLARAAEAMDMKLVYGFVPKGSDLEDIVESRARKIAGERLRRIGHSMALEAQGLDKEESQNALDNMVQKILMENYKEVWNS
jgi:predicted DNA-binding mobile mystery protein A